MALTTAELRERVAEHLRIKAADLELSGANAARIDRRIEEVTEYLRELGLAWWADGAVPVAASMPMILMVAAWSASSVGKAGQGYEDGFIGGKAQLAAIKPSAVIETLEADYF